MKIRVLACRAGEVPVVEEIENGLEAMQSFVGGYVEHIIVRRTAPHEGVCIWANDDGLAVAEPKVNWWATRRRLDAFVDRVKNIADAESVGVDELRGILAEHAAASVIVGDCFFAHDRADGETTGLTDEDLDWLLGRGVTR